MIWKKEPNLQIGDLVYHVLYGKDWLGVILKMEDELRNPRASVHMVPGTIHEWFFTRRPLGANPHSRTGWVGKHWLIKIEIN
jgi:hypothetical protein